MDFSSGGFEEMPEGEHPQQPLPPEDRLWRHPSEITGSGHFIATNDAIAVRRRWLERETSRASVWTAGVVGAVLATGLVFLGTHLATALTSPPVGVGFANDESVPSSTSQLAGVGTGRAPLIASLSSSLATRIRTIGESMAIIDAGTPGASVRCLGVIINPNGVLVAPAAALKSSTSLLVTLADGVQYVGTVIGTDASSGLATVRINGAQHLPAISLSRTAMRVGQMTLAVSATGGSTYSLGTVRDTTSPSNPPMPVGAIGTDLPAVTTPLGSALVNQNGNVVGIVTGTASSGVVATPAWIASVVDRQLMSIGHVVHGWLGMVQGTTTTIDGSPTKKGVLVQSIATKSAASEAGLVAGDIITTINGTTVTSVSALRGHLYVLMPGTTVRLGVLHDHEHVTISILLDDHEPQ